VYVNKEQLISEILLLPTTAIDYYVSQHLVQLFPDKALIEGEMGNFNLEGYAVAKHCVLTRKTFLYNQMTTHWRGPEPEVMHLHYRMMPMGRATSVNHRLPVSLENTAKEGSEPAITDTINKAWFDVHWQEHTLDVLILTIEGGGFFKYHYWILAETEEIARNFFAAVCEWNMEIRSEILVFDNGYWQKDERLFQDIQSATFDNLVLRGNLKQEIRDDLVQFFQSRTLYEEHDIPWKRGILFVGPAGNGKTHTVKALINSLEYPCLYVKSFRAPHTAGADEINIRQVFDRTRRSTPCILVLEDLDSLLTPQNRSFFLNELDGFAANIGIVALATTNHPERLDPAILERPSRFDRKYLLGLPGPVERRAYIALWNEALKPALRLSEVEMEKITMLTEGFSFAYLKELFVSSKMRWIAHPQQGTMGEVMSTQVDKLREQMGSAEMLVPPNFAENY
jgi:AAA+ superfamily predicted ATPase